MTDQTSKIRDLNDRFRRGDGTVSGTVLCTSGITTVADGDPLLMAELLGMVRSFDTFTQDNDPHGEHDFGAFEWRGEKCFWKIDVLDPSLEVAALDATDPLLSHRVLTIMLAHEY